MAWVKLLFRSVGEALCANGLRALAGVVPFGEVVYEVAAKTAERFREYRLEARERAELEAALCASAQEIREEARVVAEEVCAGHPGADPAKMAAYLAQVPPLLRQTLKRPTDPTGLTLPVSLSLQKPEDWLAFLPTRLPRFQAGDRPVGVGAWELVELLGVGGFGEVWKARHRHFDGIAPVALKFCLDPEARDRLLHHEATVLNQLMRQGRHPGIVPLLDAFLDTEPPCLKYEYVDGGDLSGLAREWHAQTPAERWEPTTRLVADLAGIVGVAHRLDPPVVHRDLKPANVLVERSGDARFHLRVTDFGIGGLAALTSVRASRTAAATGGAALATALRGAHTPLYASPQQMRGEPPDVRDDVHALGVIWYQLLCGDLSVGAPTGLWADDLTDAGVSRDLVRLLGSCVAARPERRPAHAAALAEQIRAALASEPPAIPPAPAPVLAPTAAEPPRSDRVRELVRELETGSSWLLDLTNKQIGDEGVAALANSPALARRSVLYLSGNQIGDAGVAALARSPHVANVARLILWDNQIGDRGVAALAESPHLQNLNALDLGRNRVGDAGVIALARSPHMANLGALILVSNQVGDAGAAALAESPYLANLAELKPLNNRISPAGVTALRDRFGKRVRIY
jgi:serine/threonine protein kinase